MKYLFGFSDTLLAEVGKVEQKTLHFDVESICRAYENVKPLAERLGVTPPKQKLAGFTYPHVAALGAKIVFPEASEPKPLPLIRSLKEIDQLTEPEDYLSAPLVQERLKICYELKKRYPEAPNSIGHLVEGPVTTAVLLMGSDFLTLPYDDPNQAHWLLDFCVQSALNYARAISEEFGEPIQPGLNGFPDDFAGMFSPPIFKEFVVPYWERMYQGLRATERSLHSELLRVEHLQFLKELKVDYFDPGVDQYLTPEILRKHCSAMFQARILPWQIRDLSAKELETIYRQNVKSKPYIIAFFMDRLEDESKIKHLLNIARLF